MRPATTRLAPTAPTSGLAPALVRLLAHDLRTPLGPLSLAVTSMPDAGDASAELAEIAQAQVDRMGRLIDAALAACGRPLPVEAQTFDLADAVEAAARIHRSLGGACDVRAVQCPVRGTLSLVRDAVAGLLEACTSEGGQARIRLCRSESLALIHIELAGSRSGLLDALFPDSAASAFALGARAVVRAHSGTVRTLDGHLTASFPITGAGDS